MLPRLRWPQSGRQLGREASRAPSCCRCGRLDVGSAKQQRATTTTLPPAPERRPCRSRAGRSRRPGQSVDGTPAHRSQRQERPPSPRMGQRGRADRPDRPTRHHSRKRSRRRPVRGRSNRVLVVLLALLGRGAVGPDYEVSRFRGRGADSGGLRTGESAQSAYVPVASAAESASVPSSGSRSSGSHSAIRYPPARTGQQDGEHQDVQRRQRHHHIVGRPSRLLDCRGQRAVRLAVAAGHFVGVASVVVNVTESSKSPLSVADAPSSHTGV